MAWRRHDGVAKVHFEVNASAVLFTSLFQDKWVDLL
jgi:hypothetical protein